MKQTTWCFAQKHRIWYANDFNKLCNSRRFVLPLWFGNKWIWTRKFKWLFRKIRLLLKSLLIPGKWVVTHFISYNPPCKNRRTQSRQINLFCWRRNMNFYKKFHIVWVSFFLANKSNTFLLQLLLSWKLIYQLLSDSFIETTNLQHRIMNLLTHFTNQKISCCVRKSVRELFAE